MKNAIEISNITKKYREHTALDNVSFSVPDGSIFGILGPNGAGKTTLLRIINNIIPPDSGEILLFGEPLNDKHMENIGYLPEERGLYKKMSVGDQVLYLSQLKGLSHKEAREKINYWFDKLDIKSWLGRKVEELSKGMQQKVQFIITVLHSPRLLIFDEPFSGFDPINADILKNEILELKDKGATILLSTHNMESVEELCDQIVLVNQSKLLLYGEVDNIKRKFSKNYFEISFTHPIDDQKLSNWQNSYSQFIINKNEKEPNTITISADRQIKSSELLPLILQLGEIISYREHLPSMHDIFVSVVQQKEGFNNYEEQVTYNN
jgi:ABC-2 type transport system ATP-binding protein